MIRARVELHAKPTFTIYEPGLTMAADRNTVYIVGPVETAPPIYLGTMRLGRLLAEPRSDYDPMFTDDVLPVSLIYRYTTIEFAVDGDRNTIANALTEARLSWAMTTYDEYMNPTREDSHG